ncbi:MAG: hypothetical protein JO213_00410 [Alphaproteobacteria bacterium]|nr:hypothetical protein [Alphaproteobacteria bacterium]MBV9967052.1 hypothetical protein [Alphaproteobacteria bacterium]
MPEGHPLSAAEALVLLSLPRFDGRQAVKIGLMSLQAQGILRAVEVVKTNVFGTARFAAVRVAREIKPEIPGTVPASLPPGEASLVAVVRAAEPAEGLISAIIKEGRLAYGDAALMSTRFREFVLRFVLPSLVARGLAEERQTRRFGLIPASGFYRTPAGEAERTRLTAAMQDARAIPDYLDRDPAQAAALAAAAGSAILLVAEVRPHFRRLAEALREPAGDGAYYAGAFDFSGCDFTAGDFAAGDFAGGGGFDASFSAFDAGFDAATADTSC